MSLPPDILLFRLTVAQFACITQRCQATIRRDIRARKIEAEGNPYLIHSRELPVVIDVPLAMARLSQAGLYASATRRAKAAPSPQPAGA